MVPSRRACLPGITLAIADHSVTCGNLIRDRGGGSGGRRGRILNDTKRSSHPLRRFMGRSVAMCALPLRLQVPTTSKARDNVALKWFSVHADSCRFHKPVNGTVNELKRETQEFIPIIPETARRLQARYLGDLKLKTHSKTIRDKRILLKLRWKTHSNFVL